LASVTLRISANCSVDDANQQRHMQDIFKEEIPRSDERHRNWEMTDQTGLARLENDRIVSKSSPGRQLYVPVVFLLLIGASFSAFSVVRAI